MGLRCVFQSRFWGCLQRNTSCIAGDMWLGWQCPTWPSRCGANAPQSLGLNSTASLEAFPEFNTWGNVGAQCCSKSNSGLVLLVRWGYCRVGGEPWGCVCEGDLQVLAPSRRVLPRVCGRVRSLAIRDTEGGGRKSAVCTGRGQAWMSQGQSPNPTDGCWWYDLDGHRAAWGWEVAARIP